MGRLTPRTIALGVLAVVGMALGSIGVANADPPPFTEQWWNCPNDPGHVLYNPYTGESMRVGHDQFTNPPGQPFWVWVCVDTGGFGASSVGTSGYVGSAGYVEHSNVCAGVVMTSCSESWVGADVRSPDAGAVGAKPCVFPVTSSVAACVSAGVTPSPTVPVGVSTSTPSEICVVVVAGGCAPPHVAVQAGGTVATAYVGTTPVPATVPQACAGVNRPGTYVEARPGTGC